MVGKQLSEKMSHSLGIQKIEESRQIITHTKWYGILSVPFLIFRCKKNSKNILYFVNVYLRETFLLSVWLWVIMIIKLNAAFKYYQVSSGKVTKVPNQ